MNSCTIQPTAQQIAVSDAIHEGIRSGDLLLGFEDPFDSNEDEKRYWKRVNAIITAVTAVEKKRRK